VPASATYAVFPSGEIWTNCGAAPTPTVAVTLSVAASMTDTEDEPPFVTNTWVLTSGDRVRLTAR
jgi:hypothetical protein